MPKDYTKGMRVSITLRHITSPTNPVAIPTLDIDNESESQTPSDNTLTHTCNRDTCTGDIRKDQQQYEREHEPREVNFTSFGSQTSPANASVSVQTTTNNANISSYTDPKITKCNSIGNCSTDHKEARSDTLYISSSMFRQLDCRKL